MLNAIAPNCFVNAPCPPNQHQAWFVAICSLEKPFLDLPWVSVFKGSGAGPLTEELGVEFRVGVWF